MNAQYTVFHRYGTLMAAFIVMLILLLVIIASSAGFSYFDISLLASGGTTLALAAIGGTLVILSGGFDLSVGAVISLVNVVLAAGYIDDNTPAAFALSFGLAILVGAACGLVNGVLVAYARIQPIVVTLSTMFIIQGITLLVMNSPGGTVPSSLGTYLMGDILPELFPASLFLILLSLLVWAWIKRTPFGLHLYATGGNAEAARAVGIPIARSYLLTYTLAGAFYGLAGFFLSAQTGAGDPLVGNSLLLSVFAAIVIGGTRLGGGKGGPVGSVIGAFVLMLIVNILLLFNISAYYSTIAQGVVLIMAVMISGFGKEAELRKFLRLLRHRIQAMRQRRLASQLNQESKYIDACAGASASPDSHIAFNRKHQKDLRISLPALCGLIVLLIATQIFLGRNVFEWSYWNSMLVLSTFLIILALGQGVVVFTGGLDLSLPWTIALSGILFTGLTQGTNEALIYALPLILFIGILIGFANGIMVAVLGISPIVATLASNGILQGIALLYSGGTPSAYPSPLISWLMTARIAGITPVIFLLIIFVILAVFLLNKTRFGRHVYATGSNLHAAYLSGVPTRRILILVYVLSSLSAAVVGVLLTGFSGQASLGMGDDYLLPSIAVIVVGGGLITGGRGHYLGILAGVLLLTTLQILLAGSGLPYAVRPILFGFVLLAAVALLREKAR
ncbi:ABC transporter permease [Advenella kashmirensis]|uniref:ABC transporter permease n=1 Tax=Advenella kashmirensis TaxID=310575 RepID=UPI000425ED22|nr:ABC transporter permease [Advenella kashmirensis]